MNSKLGAYHYIGAMRWTIFKLCAVHFGQEAQNKENIVPKNTPDPQRSSLQLRDWSHRPLLAPSVNISVVIVWKMMGQHIFLNMIPQQFHGLNRMESLVWLGHELSYVMAFHHK